ncbi:S-adenosyl-L-methionine-dependent methyltransferase [Hyaloraphidium curvatum]|nr:S-adenosyl-L-methionine-dependent methyltransferase [Hyaloraphidium curvatum]
MLKAFFMPFFGQPSGLAGRIGGYIMARSNAAQDSKATALLPLEPSGEHRILEIGFGPGTLVAHLLDAFPRATVCGIDPSAEMVGMAKQRVGDKPRAVLEIGSASKLPHEDAKFDAVLAVNTYHLWPDPTAGTREALRVLKPGGHLLFVIRVQGQGVASSGGVPREETQARLKSDLDEAGARIADERLETGGWVSDQWWVLAKKE